jgi:flagellar motor switch protein FliM
VSQTLSPEEVDALLPGAKRPPSAAREAPLEPGDGVRAYDLATPERGAPLPALELINERFVRHLRTGLARFVQRPVEVSALPVQVMRFDAFLAQGGAAPGMHLVRVRPLQGMGLVLCDAALAQGVVDVLFGGTGAAPAEAPAREVSATEQRIVQRLVETFGTEYARSWAPVYPLAMSYARAESDPRFAQIALPAESVVACRFDVTLGPVSGRLHLAVPLGSFEPIRDILQSSAQGDATGSDPHWVDLLMQQLKSASVELVAELAHGQATVGELLALKKGDFIELDRQPTLVAKVDGVPVFECDYGTLAHRYGLRIREFLTQPAAALSSPPRENRRPS